ncbi:MAG: hypothetical protein AAGA48_37755 [Myxococcota bacterium]
MSNALRILVVVVLVVTGTAFAVLAASPAYVRIDQSLGWLFWPEPAAVGMGPWGRLAFVIAGGLMAGWGVTLLLADRYTLPQALVAGMLTWFVVDSLGSVAVGAVGNLIPNTLTLVPFLVVAGPHLRREPSPA